MPLSKKWRSLDFFGSLENLHLPGYHHHHHKHDKEKERQKEKEREKEKELAERYSSLEPEETEGFLDPKETMTMRPRSLSNFSKDTRSAFKIR
jgi:hypothetical protein